ncbi:hypothetical protein [Nocardia sp. SSK8]|uniref:hypothetical protein n=1 Tax=Nocardia sp. SSK8 TaxID=3120154 RepID=UPI0030095117
MRVALHPRLYDPLVPHPILNGVRCDGCHLVYFPPIAIGCERCGATQDQLTPLALTAAGTVFATAEVAVNPQGDAPFTAVEVILDDGPLIRAVAHPESPPLAIGDHVWARWSVARTDEQGRQVVEPAFTKAAADEVRS